MGWLIFIGFIIYCIYSAITGYAEGDTKKRNADCYFSRYCLPGSSLCFL